MRGNWGRINLYWVTSGRTPVLAPSPICGRQQILMGYELISALSALDLSQGCNYLPTPALTLHTHHMRGEELQEGEQLPLFFPPISYRFRRLSGDVDFVSLFISFHRVWQLERTGQGFGQQEHSSCGSKSPVLPSPKAGPPGMWQGQPIFPACA